MDHVSTLDPRLKSATKLEMAEQLHQLFSSLPQRAGDDPVAVMNGYLIAIQGLPLWAIAKTVQSYLRGLVKGQDNRFCPRAPEFATAVREERDSTMHASAKSLMSKGRSYNLNIPKSKIIARKVTHEQTQEGRQCGIYPPDCIWLPGYINDRPHIGEVYAPDADWQPSKPLT